MQSPISIDIDLTQVSRNVQMAEKASRKPIKAPKRAARSIVPPAHECPLLVQEDLIESITRSLSVEAGYCEKPYLDTGKLLALLFTCTEYTVMGIENYLGCTTRAAKRYHQALRVYGAVIGTL